MSGKKYVPEGVYLVCDKGSKPSEFIITYYAETSVYGEHMATEADKILVANFEPFGACACNQGKPCAAQVTNWENVTDGITLDGNSLLLEDSELPCAVGGTIKIYFSLQAAMAAVPEPEEEERDFWDKALDFGAGLGEGLWKGAKGTVTGIYDLGVWAGKHSTPYMLLNPEGFKEQLQKDKETLGALGNAAKEGGIWVYRNSTVNAIINPGDHAAAQAETAQMVEGWKETMANMDAREWGDVTGQVLFEVGAGVATAGAGTAATAAKAADKGVDIARAVNAADNVADGARGARVVENADDVADGARALENSMPEVPEELGPVVNKTDDIPSKKPYANSRPTYRDGVVDEVWDTHKQPDGNVYDPNTGELIEWDKSKPRNGQWDMGHKPGHEYRKLHQDYMDDHISKEEFLNEYNNPDNYWPELPKNNRSHKYESD